MSSIPKPSGPKKAKKNPLPGQFEEQLLRAGSRYFSTHSPNPKREGCPGGGVLKALAWQRKVSDAEAVVAHLSQCSPCFLEHRRHIKSYRLYRGVQRIAALLLVVVGVTWLWLKYTSAPVKKDTPEIIKKAPVVAPQSPPQQEPVFVVLDLRNKSYARGEDTPPENGVEKDRLKLPRENVRLKIYLPFGSEAGSYEMELRKPKRLLRLSGKAQIRDGVTALEVQTDLSGMVPGTYRLAIRPPESTVWRVYALDLR